MNSPWLELKLWPEGEKKERLLRDEKAASDLSFDRNKILGDYRERIGIEFNVPEGLKNRVGFWFDIYTKYDSKHYVIHDRKHPWIIYEVVDGTNLFARPKVSWLNRVASDKFAAQRKSQIEGILKKLSKGANTNTLSLEEQRIVEVLKTVEGKRTKVYKDAARDIRIQLGQRDFFLQGLKNSAPYLPVMQQIFEQKGLPRELVRIPLVESSFNVVAYSKVGAKGVWQIMPNVGKSKMVINDQIDERRSPLKSTIFAASLLRGNYKSLKKWPLAVTAYNHGVGSMSKAVKKLRTDSLLDIIKNYNVPSFQFASSNFYSCFLAALHAEVYRDQIFTEMTLAPAINWQLVTLNKAQKIKSILVRTKLSQSDLIQLNPELTSLKPGVTLPRGFKFYVPAQARARHSLSHFKLRL